MKELISIFSPREHPQMAIFVSQVVMRLLLAAFLGGIIGLEREMKRKAAGLRTNMFICFGSAMFTLLSSRLASEFGGDHTRIAAQIIPGIGFIGAGSILHSRGNVQGLTSAATIFVVASIGMAAGAGLYLPALFATIVLLTALHALGILEGKFHFKPIVATFEATGDSAETLISAINEVVSEREEVSMQSLKFGRGERGEARVLFSILATRRQQEQLLRDLRDEAVIRHVTTLSAREQE